MILSIVIVSWNIRRLLQQCLSSVYANPPDCPFEVVVVDNQSSDGSPEMVKTFFPQVRLIESPKNLGFAGGNNLAIPYCNGNYVLLLNPDTEVRSGALQHLIVFLESNSKFGAAGSRLLNADGSLQVSCHPAPTLARELWRLFHLDKLKHYAAYPMDTWSASHPQTVDVLMGACLILRREVLEQVGLFDEAYFMYSEEVDLCRRVQQAGWKLAWVPQAQVVHYGGQSTQQIAGEMFLQLYHAKVLYFRKHYGWSTAQAYKLILLAATLARLALTPLALFERPQRRNQHLTLSGQYRRLLLALPEM